MKHLFNFLKKFFIFVAIIYLIFAYYQQPKRVHIFVDYATSPTVLQMVKFIKLPEKDIKIIAWDRYRYRDIIIKKRNIQQNVIDVSGILRSSLSNKYQTMSYIINSIESSNNNTIYEIHLNYKHIGWFGLHFFKLIPPHKIKQVHLYEDGLGTLYKEINDKKIQNNGINYAKEFLIEIQKSIPAHYHPNNYVFTLPMYYPTTLHTSIAHKVKDIEKRPYYKKFKKLTIEPVDFRAFKTELSPVEKTKLYNLLGINFLSIHQKMQKGKPFGIFLWDGYDLPKRYKTIEQLLDKMEEHSKKHGTIWFSKNHPTAFKPYLPRPFLKPLPAHFPMEVLLLSDYPFQYVAGAGSSAFYSVKPEEIVAFIPNHRYGYIQSLLNLGILEEDKIYRW